MNYLASPPLVVAYALAGRMDVDLVNEPLGEGTDGEPVYLRDIWPTQQEVQDVIADAVQSDMFRRSYARRLRGRRALERASRSRGRHLRVGRDSTYVLQAALLRGHGPRARRRSSRSRAPACSRCSATASRPTTSRPPARSAGRPGRPYLIEHGVEQQGLQLLRLAARQPRGDDARHVRQRPPAQPARARHRGRRGRCTSRAARRCRSSTRRCATCDEGVPLVVLAGKEYGSGSSRDWAAKGPRLLGVRSVIAESYERIHRSNLVGMGVLPLQFAAGEIGRVARADRRGDLRCPRHRRGGRPRDDGRRALAGRRGEIVHGDGADRHAAGMALLPQRRDPPLRPAPATRQSRRRLI